MSTKIGSTNVLPIFFVQKSLTNEGIVAYIYQYKKRELRLIVPSYFFLMVIRLCQKKVVPLHT